MKTILVAAQKGGVGKTTISNELAFQLEDMGKKVSFANLDNQGGQIFPDAPVEPTTEFQIVDTPGVLTENFMNWCRGADYVVIPTLASGLDLPALQRIYQLALESGTPVGIVINQFDDRQLVDHQFKEYLRENNYPVIATIPRAAAVKQAQMQRTSINNVRTQSTAGIRFAGLASNILQSLKD